MKKLTTLTVLVSLLAACGGGGSSKGDAKKVDTETEKKTYRISQSNFDLDGNGITDHVQKQTYNSLGQITEVNLSYLGDGVADSVQGFDKSHNTKIVFNYSDNRISSTTFTNPNLGIKFQRIYDWNGVELNSLTEDTYNSSGALLSRGFYSLTYNQGLKSWTYKYEDFSDPSNNETSSTVIEFDTAAVPTGYITTREDGTKIKYNAIRKDGLLTRFTESPVDKLNEVESFLEVTFNADNYVTKVIDSQEVVLGFELLTNGVNTFQYKDERIDSILRDTYFKGVNNITVKIIWEEGKCIPAITWDDDITLGSGLDIVDNKNHSSAVGFTKPNFCSDAGKYQK